MGILDLMFGQSSPGEQGVEGKSYTLPQSTHDFVYPVAVRQEELEAFGQLLAADADAPALEENTDELQDALDSVLDGHDIDAAKLAEKRQQPRREAEPVIDHWHEQLDGELGVVYARPGTYESLRSFVALCTRRDEDDDDPFDRPESFPTVVAFLKRLEEATESQYRAVVHTDLLPS
ncbi:hypothetical protein ACLI4Z_14835 [Natrialbaceae archaeon A-arb3/5]